MNKVIVTTSINGPTDAIRKFAAMEDWTLVDVLDKKSPEENGGDRLPSVIYLNCVDQEKMDPKLSDAIGWNCIQRRNFGFIYAVKELKADIVATVDDDNVPHSDWGENLFIGKETPMRYWHTHEPVFDPVCVAGYPHLWHRGFPLQYLAGRKSKYDLIPAKYVTADVQANFWDGDPDVDAICRMEHAPECSFERRFFPMASNAPSPFNSQNTILLAKVIPHYFMFPGVGRFDDILGSYYVQKQGFKVAYGHATVSQKRNEHDLIKDMAQEQVGHEICSDMFFKGKGLDGVFPLRAGIAFSLYQAHFD